MKCVIFDCDQSTGDRRHLCQCHYERLRLRGTTYKYRESTCSVCDRRVVAHGLCRTHYMKVRRTGTLEQLRRPHGPRRQTHREKHLWNRYRITPEAYADMESAQRGRCAICDTAIKPGRMFVDHDHATGEVRSLLCRRCNTVLGFVEGHEDADKVLAGVLAYCEAHCI